MFGHHGRIITIDVTDSGFRIERYDEAFAKAYLGGNGFAAKVIYESLRPGLDAFDPRNTVVFTVGPVTDTAIPSTSRAYVASKSPLNGLYFDSTFGGRFAITQKRTGFDAIVITGKSPAPAYIYVDENRAEVKSAEDLWGKTTEETAEILLARYGNKAKEVFFAKNISCAQCSVACGKISSVKTGPDAGLSWKMPEYETIYDL